VDEINFGSEISDLLIDRFLAAIGGALTGF
jgi:hypothetical protein